MRVNLSKSQMFQVRSITRRLDSPRKITIGLLRGERKIEKKLMKRIRVRMIALAGGIEVWLWSEEKKRKLFVRIRSRKEQENSLLSRNRISGWSRQKR